jgi:hypothetical protein
MKACENLLALKAAKEAANVKVVRHNVVEAFNQQHTKIETRTEPVY